MTHVDGILLSSRDAERDAATELYLTEHLRHCAECREVERQVGRIDRLIAIPEPPLPLPPRTMAAHGRSAVLQGAPRAVALGVAVLGAIALGVALREAREDQGTAGSSPTTVASPAPGTSIDPPKTLGGVTLGMSGDQVRAVLGDPDRTGPGLRWEYARGLVLQFQNGTVDRPGALNSILATSPGHETGNAGVAVGDPEDAFLELYRDSVGAYVREDGRTTYFVAWPRRGDEVAALHVTAIGGRIESVQLVLDDSPAVTFLAPPRESAADGQPVAVGPYQVDLAWRQALERGARESLDELTFTPLIPDHVTFRTTPITSTSACGIATTPCLRFDWYIPNASLKVLQGPAGCCLDAARPNAIRNIEIRPGVLGQLLPIGPAYGGSILWWTEPTAKGDVYIAISGTPMGQEELVKIAQSLRPLD